MDPLTTAAASGLRSRIEALEMLANNIANAATAGYKSDRESYNLYLAPEALDGMAASGDTPTTVPVIETQWTDFSQGTLTPTGNPLDLALSGKGFFAVAGPSGPLYTRSGSFQLSRTGLVTNADGYAVRAVGGRPIQSRSAAPLEISPDGTVRQESQVLGQLEIVDFARPAALEKYGKNYFRPVDTVVAPRTVSDVSVQQGKLESANVTAAESAVQLVGVMRQFETLQKALALGAEMNRSAEEVAKVGS